MSMRTGPFIRDMDDIIAVTARWDNWVYLHRYMQTRGWTVDAPDTAGVFCNAEDAALTLTHVLMTHHHADHTEGLSALKNAYACTVLSPDAERITETDVTVKDGDTLTLGDWSITVMATPGHTRSSVCYFCTHPTEPPALYAGDTLFACGCGRLFEADAETMYRSLCRLAKLPEATRVYPGHDYLEENIEFALTLEPDNDALKQLLAQAHNYSGFFPTTLAQEKQCNPFLRCNEPAIRRATGRDGPVEVFAELRRRKDRF